MNNLQQSRFDANERVEEFTITHAIILAVILEFAGYKTAHDVLMAEIRKAIQKQTADIKVATPDKGKQKIKMCDTVIKFASRGCVKANMEGEALLEAGLNKPLSYVLQANDDLAKSRCIDLKDLMKTNLTVLDNLDAADITEMEDAIADFSDIKKEPKKLRDDRKTEGTDPIPGLLDQLDVPKMYMGKLIHSYAPALAASWDQNVKVGKPLGTRHLSLVAVYKDEITVAPLVKVKVTVTNGVKTFVKFSTEKGSVRFYGLESGNWTMTAEHEMYEKDVVENIKIVEEETAKFDIRLQKLDAGAVGLYGKGHGLAFDVVTMQPIGFALVFFDGVESPIVCGEFGTWVKEKLSKDCSWMRMTAPGYEPFFAEITITADADNHLDGGMTAVGVEPPPVG